jgi:hypothetical protein
MMVSDRGRKSCIIVSIVIVTSDKVVSLLPLLPPPGLFHPASIMIMITVVVVTLPLADGGLSVFLPITDDDTRICRFDGTVAAGQILGTLPANADADAGNADANEETTDNGRQRRRRLRG